MIIIKNARDQLNLNLKKIITKPCEDLEKEFEDFCKSQTEKVCSFSEVYEESHDWIKDLNKEFELEKNNSGI